MVPVFISRLLFPEFVLFLLTLCQTSVGKTTTQSTDTLWHKRRPFLHFLVFVSSQLGHGTPLAHKSCDDYSQ